MDTKQLITFAALVEQLNYQKVADRLNYAPSTLKSHIQALEEELGVELFQKEGRQLQLTAAGAAFREYANKMLEDYYQALGCFDLLQPVDRCLTIGGCDMNLIYELNSFFTSYARIHPQVHLDMSVSSNASAPERLANHEIDVAFYYSRTPNEIEGLNSVFLYQEAVFLMAAKTHPRAEEKGLRYSDLVHQQFVYPHRDCCFTEELLLRIQKACYSRITPSCLGSVGLAINQALENHAIMMAPHRAAQYLEKSFNLTRLDIDEEPVTVWQRILYSSFDSIHPSAKGMVSFCVKQLSTVDK